MTKAVISIGSNVINNKEIVLQALKELTSCTLMYTMPYIDPNECDNNPQYINSIAIIETSLEFAELRSYFKQFEARYHREHGTDLVTLDIDIVIYDGIVMRRKDMLKTYFTYGFKMLSRDSIERES